MVAKSQVQPSLHVRSDDSLDFECGAGIAETLKGSRAC